MTAPGKLISETRKLEAHLIRKSHTKLRLATVNIGTMIGRSAEVTEMVGRRQLDVVAIQKICFRNEGVKRVKGGEYKYRLYWSGDEKVYGGVGLMVRHDLAKFVMALRRVSPKLYPWILC